MANYQPETNQNQKKVNRVNDQFDDWLRDVMPEEQEDETKKEIHLAILKERMRSRKIKQRKRRNRTFWTMGPVILLTVFAGNVVELGSDGFDVERMESEATLGDVVKMGHREEGISFVDGESDEEIQEFIQQSAAGEGVVLDMEGWVIGGNEYWAIRREFSIDGEITSSHPETPYRLKTGKL